MAPRVVVVGGGITGVVAALHLSQRGADVVLVEREDRLGGKIQTGRLGNATIELGADSFLPRDDRPLELCSEVGLEDDLVEPSDFGAWIFHQDRLHRMPYGTVLGAPGSLGPLLKTGLLSWRGKARAAWDLAGGLPLTGPDVSVGSLVRARFGNEILERMVDPLLAGTRAGNVDEMSLAAAIPPLDTAARDNGSLIRGLRRARGTSKLSFKAPREGMSRLMEALEAKLMTVEILKGHRAVAVKRDGKDLTVELDGSDPLNAAGVVLATPSYITAELVSALVPEAAAELNAIPHSSAAVVNLVFPADGVVVPSGGSGVLVPSRERMTLAGCTWFSTKWPALASPDGELTIRCFVGRSERDPALDLDDRDLLGVVLTELGRLVTVSEAPLASHVKRWDRALPQYEVGHLERVSRIEKLLAQHPGLTAAGAGFRGSGIPDCIAQAERAVEDLVERVRR